MFAQILKHNMMVDLIGGEEVGLPINHPSIICMDLANRADTVEVGMYYNPTLDTFSYEREPIIIPPTSEEIVIAEMSISMAQMQAESNQAIAELTTVISMMQISMV